MSGRLRRPIVSGLWITSSPRPAAASSSVPQCFRIRASVAQEAYDVIPRTSLLLVDRHCGPERCLRIADVPTDAVVHDACDGTVPASVKGRVGWRSPERGLQVGGRIGNRSVDEGCDVTAQLVVDLLVSLTSRGDLTWRWGGRDPGLEACQPSVDAAEPFALPVEFGRLVPALCSSLLNAILVDHVGALVRHRG